jgi:hypothetical protein
VETKQDRAKELLKQVVYSTIDKFQKEHNPEDSRYDESRLKLLREIITTRIVDVVKEYFVLVVKPSKMEFANKIIRLIYYKNLD